jgi:hypothetical protein
MRVNLVLIKASQKISFVVELENAALVSWHEVTASLTQLLDQMLEHAHRQPVEYELLLAAPGNVADGRELLTGLLQRLPQLAATADVQVVSVEGGRYYELKNAGIARSTGDVVVFLDSDCTIEPGWLQTILEPFQSPGLHVVSGYTYLAHNDITSRTLALIWFFPLRDRDIRAGERRALNINNCAFSGDWIRAHPFEIDLGFKVSCTKLAHRIAAAGLSIERVSAYAAHAPLRGWRFLAWRAWVTGRDADRKHRDLRSPRRLTRLVHALKFTSKLGLRSLRRVLTHHRLVAMPWYEVPCALLMAAAFALLTLLGQVLHAAGFRSRHPELIPAYAEHT